MQALANVATSHDGRHRPPLMRGQPLVADEHRAKGRGNAAWNKEGAKALLLIRSASCAVPSQKIATWSAEEAGGLSQKPAAPPKEVPTEKSRRLGAPLPHLW